MRYLKICVLSFFLLLHIFVLTASAHTGRTDSNGGHYDWSTGEYHYHHGYPAHDHYDMDGDGFLDCPYDFDDRTGENSGGSSGSSSGNAGIDAWEKYKRENPDLFSQSSVTKPTHQSIDFTEKSDTGLDTTIAQVSTEGGASIVEIWKVCVLIAFFGAIFTIMCFILRYQVLEKRKQKIQFEKDIQNERTLFGKYLEEMNSELVKRYGESYLYKFCDAPPGDYVGSDGLPTSQLTYDYKWGRKYTFYLGGYPAYNRKYHKFSCRYADHLFPINAFSIKQNRYNNYLPCAICKPSLPDTRWVNKFLRCKAFLTEYNVSVPQELQAIDFNEHPNLGEITREHVEKEAIAMGVSFELALKMINSERAMFGAEPISESILTGE